MDLWPMDVRRFGEFHSSQRFLRDRTIEVYGSYYVLQSPFSEHKSSRNVSKRYQILHPAHSLALYMMSSSPTEHLMVRSLDGKGQTSSVKRLLNLLQPLAILLGGTR